MAIAPPPAEALAAWEMAPSAWESAGGTAGTTWRLTLPDGTRFLRRRGARTSTDARIAFDHGLRRHLLDHGFPTAAPLPTRDGIAYLRLADGVYELYPWVNGTGPQPAFAGQIRVTAARTLARFHEVAASYPGVCEATVPQFGHYPRPVPEAARFDWPLAFVDVLDQLAPWARNEAERQALGRARYWVAWLYGQYSSSRYQQLPQGIIHGDYNAANLLFDATGEIVGVFDFDWTWRDSRVRDIGAGLFFFGAERDRATDGGDIWSLTACPELTTPGMIEFLRAYHAAAPLTRTERHAVPLAMLGMWVACRLEGAMKVPEPDRVRFATWDFERPFAWYQTDAADLLGAID